MANNIEKRKHTRIEVTWHATVLDDKGIEGEVRNISTAGMFIRCGKPLRINELYRFSLLDLLVTAL